MVKVLEGSNGQKLVTLPKELATAMGWNHGDELSFSIESSKSLKLTEK